MKEANEMYKSAAKYYEQYLQLNPNAADKNAVTETINRMKIAAKSAMSTIRK